MLKSTQRLLKCILAVQLQQPLISLSIVLSLNMGKSSILKGMKWKLQKDTSIPSKLHCHKKPGPMRQLGLDDKVLLVLMRVGLEFPIEDLTFPLKFLLGMLQKILQPSQFF